MRYAIVESGGKQYRVVEGGTLDVDRLPVEPGKKMDLENILLMADGEEVMVGTPTVSGILVQTTVLAHVKGPKVVSFKYRPKKRIRVKGGHRHQYTRLMVDFIGRPGEERKVAEKVEKPAVAKEAEIPAVIEKAAASSARSAKPVKAVKEAPKKPAPRKEAPRKVAPAKKPAATTKSTTSKKPATTTKKTTKK